MTPAEAIAAAVERDDQDHDELVDRMARSLVARAHYRDARIRESAARALCRHRGHRPDGIRGCAECRADIILTGGI